jgi:hypothetical protein
MTDAEELKRHEGFWKSCRQGRVDRGDFWDCDSLDCCRSCNKDEQSVKVVKALVIISGGLLIWLIVRSMLIVDTPTLRLRTGAEMAQLARAMKEFKRTYGRLPMSPEGSEDTEEGNAALVRALTGRDLAANPRGIKFLEVRAARYDLGTFRSGLDQRGAWVDYWKNYYRIRWKEGGGVRNPYVDAGGEILDAETIVWSLGPDGRQGALRNSTEYEGSDDMLSWEFRR